MVLKDEKVTNKKINQNDVTNVFFDIINKRKIEKSEIETQLAEAPFENCNTYMKLKNYFTDKYKNRNLSERELGEYIVEDLENSSVLKFISPTEIHKKGPNKEEPNKEKSNEEELNELANRMKDIRYYHYTIPENVDSIFNQGLSPQNGGTDGGLASTKMNTAGIEEERIKWSRGFTFITRNTNDMSNYKKNRKKIDVFVPDTVPLRIDFDSFGYKTNQALTWIGYDKRLNYSAKIGMFKYFDNNFDNDTIEKAYKNISAT